MGVLCLSDGLGLGLVVQSYVDEATITFTACRKLMPDPEFYAQCIEDSFTELRDLARLVPAPIRPETKASSAKPVAKSRKVARK